MLFLDLQSIRVVVISIIMTSRIFSGDTLH
jgi:hypothetical protein